MTEMSSAPTLRIDIWSDVVCPWCFLGKRRFERALSLFETPVKWDIHWRAFALDPTATATPSNLKASLEAKYGPGSFEGMTSRLGALGPDVGIHYRFDRALRVSTTNAHRLSTWAYETAGAEKQGQIIDALFRAYFEEGINIASPEELMKLADAVGLSGGEAAEMLASDAFRSEVARDIAAATERDITGVPAFVVEDSFIIPGAQEIETFTHVLGKIVERLTNPNSSE